MKPILSLLAAAALLLAAPAVAQSQDPGGGDPAPGGAKPEPAAGNGLEIPAPDPAAAVAPEIPDAMKRNILASSAVVLARCVGVSRSPAACAEPGDFVLRIRIEKVLKGVLDPVRTVTATLPPSCLEAYRGFIDSVFAEKAEPCILFLDETDRFKTPPLFRFASTAEPCCMLEPIERFVVIETSAAITALSAGTPSDRESAMGSLVRLGSPALDPIETARGTMNAESAALARSVILRILEKRVDPCRVVQPNPKYPHEPVDVFLSPEQKEVCFKLSPGTTVFRFDVHSTTGRRSVKIRTADGREGWLRQESCSECDKE